jgi:hypothetical protein
MKTTKLAPRLKALAKSINSAHDAMSASWSDALEHAFAVGQALCDAKDLLKHGEWIPWLEKNCPKIPDRTARHFMKVSKTASFADFSSAKNIGDLFIMAGVTGQKQLPPATAFEPKVIDVETVPSKQLTAPTTERSYADAYTSSPSARASGPDMASIYFGSCEARPCIAAEWRTAIDAIARIGTAAPSRQRCQPQSRCLREGQGRAVH